MTMKFKLFETCSEKINNIHGFDRKRELIIFKSDVNNLKDLTRLYGPATSCVEISKLGYSLNGYYLVEGKKHIKKKSS